MKLRYFLTSIVACLTLAIGCTKEDLPGLSEIQVTPSYFTFGVDGGAKELTVTAVSDWAVSDVPEWLTVTPASGTATPAEGVKVTVTAAATTAEKIVTGTIKFTCAGKTQLVTVGQEAFVPDYPKFEAGEYWIMFGEEVAVPVSSSYGYLYTAKASKSEDGKLSSTADNIFTFTAVEGGFTIQDANGMYYYMKGTYTSFNLDASPVDGSVFTVKQTGDDKFIITNANGKVMQYDPAYSSAGAYDTEKAGAIYPNLVSVAGGEIAEVLFAVEPTEVSVEKAAGEFNINMTCKTGAFEINPSADWITLKGMTSTNGEYVVTFSYTENTAAARTATIDFVSGEETISVAVVQAGSIAEISVADFLALEKGEALYKLTGKVSGLKAGNYGNFHLVDATGSVYVYGLTATPVEKNDQSFPTLGIREGDIVTIIGKRDRYDGAKVENEKDQVGGPAYYVSHVGSTDVTVDEFLAKSKDAEVRYRLTGKITNLKTGNYGNFHLEDATGSVYVYGLTVAPVAKNDQSFPTLGLKEGDVVTLVGTRDRYDGAKVENEKDQVGGPAYYVSHEAGATEPEPETPATKAERNLAFSAETASATLGEAFTAPTLSGEATGVAYSSSNTAVATVDAATGAVTLVAAGETTITAAAEETETLLAGTASYTLTVAEAVAPSGIASIKALASDAGTAFNVVLTDAIVTCVSGSNAYVQDENDGILIYASGHGLAVGDKLNGEVSGTVKFYNNLREITAIDLSKAEKSTSTDIPVTELTIAELNAEGAYDKYESMRILIKDAEMTAEKEMTQNGQKYALYFKKTPLTGYDMYNRVNVIGYPGKFYENVQFNVFENAEVLGATKTVFTGFSNIEVTVGESKANVATPSSGATVTYESLNTAVATVDQAGMVTGVSEGEATITAKVGAHNGYPAAEVTCVVTVLPAGTVVEKAWTLVTSASSLEAGDKIIIVAKASNYAMSTTQNTNNRAQVAVTKSGNTVTFTTAVQEITLEAGTKSGTFAFNVGASKYLYAASSSSNHLKTGSKNDNASWKIEIASSGVATIKAQGASTRNWLRYNSTNNPPLFSCYGSGQADVAIYKYQ